MARSRISWVWVSRRSNAPKGHLLADAALDKTPPPPDALIPSPLEKCMLRRPALLVTIFRRITHPLAHFHNFNSARRKASFSEYFQWVRWTDLQSNHSFAKHDVSWLNPKSE